MMPPDEQGPPRYSSHMNGLFRFRDAARRNPAVDAWLRAQAPGLGPIATAWFEAMRACGPDVRDVMHDGCPTACVRDAAFAYVAVFRAHVNVGFFHGAELPDPKGLLEGTGKRMRHVKVRPGVALETAAVAALIRAAYENMRPLALSSNGRATGPK